MECLEILLKVPMQAALDSGLCLQWVKPETQGLPGAPKAGPGTPGQPHATKQSDPRPPQLRNLYLATPSLHFESHLKNYLKYSHKTSALIFFYCRLCVKKA